MPALQRKAEVQLMKQSDTPVMSGFLNHSRFAPLVVVQNTMKYIAFMFMNSCFYFFVVGKVEPNVLKGGSVAAGAKVFVRLKESPQKGICLLTQVDVNSSERGEKSVYPEEG